MIRGVPLFESMNQITRRAVQNNGKSRERERPRAGNKRGAEP
jgi:hypothetical protein